MSLKRLRFTVIWFMVTSCAGGTPVEDETDSDSGAPGSTTTSTTGMTAATTMMITGTTTGPTTSSVTSTGGAVCGDGMRDPGEVCDDGKNDGGYDGCNSDCMSHGPFCGDGTPDVGFETCDAGPMNGMYGYCDVDCQGLGPSCGDTHVDSPHEFCDEGPLNGVYECNVDCSGYATDWCGDAKRDALYESCDDGLNTGAYGTCNPDCSLAPYCGDGTVDSPNEVCDDGPAPTFVRCVNSCQTEVRRAFVTSYLVRGDLSYGGGFDVGGQELPKGAPDQISAMHSGVARGDAWCNELAKAAGLQGGQETRFRAWLSGVDAQNGSFGPASDFGAAKNGYSGEYYCPGGTADEDLVAIAWAGLISGSLERSLNCMENGTAGDSNLTDVWTNTRPDGTGGKWAMNQLDDADCGDWKSTDGFGNTGSTAVFENGGWTADGSSTCNKTARLYCIEDP